MAIRTLAARVKRGHFSGVGKVHDAAYDGLAEIIRGLAIDNARNKIESAGVTDATDSSTGTAVTADATRLTAGIVALAIPTAFFDAASAGGADVTETNTAIGVVHNALAALADHVNNLAGRLGLPVVTWATGSVATAHTIPAITKTVATANGANAVGFTTGTAAMNVLRNNFATVLHALNRALTASGYAVFKDNSGGSPQTDDTPVMTTTSATTGGQGTPAGAASVSKAVMDAFLTGLANNVATTISYVNNVFGAVSTTDITDSSGGSASATRTLAAMTLPTAVNGAATTSSPKTEFDTEIVKYEDAIAELAAKLNPLLERFDVPLLIDNTGAAVNGTIAALVAALTAVDGSGGTLGLNATDGIARLTTAASAMRSIAAKLNQILPAYGEWLITDSIGVGTVSDTLANIAVSGAAGTGTADCLLDTAVDAALVVLKNSAATLAAVINVIVGAGTADRPLSVAAA